MTREEVYKLIDGERDYQEEMKAKHGSVTRSPSDYFLIIAGYINEATAQNMTNAGTDSLLISLRKIAALSVACMEDNGAPARGEDPQLVRWRE